MPVGGEETGWPLSLSCQGLGPCREPLPSLCPAGQDVQDHIFPVRLRGRCWEAMGLLGSKRGRPRLGTKTESRLEKHVNLLSSSCYNSVQRTCPPHRSASPPLPHHRAPGEQPQGQLFFSILDLPPNSSSAWMPFPFFPLKNTYSLPS